MKQAFGFILTICLLPLLFFVGQNMWDEIAQAEAYEKHLENAIQLPPFQAQLPVVLKDQNNEVFSEEYVEWRQPLPLNEIPQIVKEVYLISEDESFYDHIGFDVTAIARAFIANSASDSIQQGGSTITQQLVRMRYLTTEKSYERKLMELFYAYELEKLYSKDDIFEMYLNEMYFGSQVYGIGSAATYYFGKELQELSIAETAFIAAIPNNPTLYNPKKNFDLTKERQERLIDGLIAKEVISPEVGAEQKASPIKLNIKEKIQLAPSYSTYVLQELRWLISEKEGFTQELNEAPTAIARQEIEQQLDLTMNELLAKGINVHTALNLTKQQEDDRNINGFLNHYPFEASATVIDNNTREIVSIYGGRNYEKFNLHRAYQMPRQPGSTFKPLIDYAPAFEHTNYTTNSLISGGPYCVGNFCPQNYGGLWHGKVTLAKAFSWSYNTSALRLLNKVGLENAFSYIDRFQFRSIVQEDRNYAAALGGLTHGVTTLELADAYTSFVDGSYKPARAIRKVTDLDGELLYAWEDEPTVMWNTKTTRNMRSLLAEAVKTGTADKIYSNGGYVGAKTGTTNRYRDFWIAGLNDNYTTAIWIGFDKGESMERYENAKVHQTIFNSIMNN